MRKVIVGMGIRGLPYNPELIGVRITYIVGRGWQLTTDKDGCIYTPQAFEATFGGLPPCPKSKGRGVFRPYRDEWYAHQHQKDYKGFCIKNPKTT